MILFKTSRFIVLWFAIITDLGPYVLFGVRGEWLDILITISLLVAGAYPDDLLENQIIKWISVVIIIAGGIGEWVSIQGTVLMLFNGQEYLFSVIELVPLIALMLLLYRIIYEKKSGRLIPEVTSFW